MKSPRFDARAGVLRRIFSPANLERVWKDKVRVSMRDQYLNDGIENFDFHTARRQECRKLSLLILKGDYVPQKAQRILVEKSKGLCRQLVIPAARDALVLQCLSDALYQEIRDKAPTNRAFFEPNDHSFSKSRDFQGRDLYGTFASWLNFQRELFSFSKDRAFVVVTDIANYYDSISYIHLRNVIAPIGGVEECVLDMLIHVLSSLLWQPDYMPSIEIGLPQINLDAPRLLAHCFLYELDAFLASDTNRDFVRYMDDIDIGVDSLADAKRVLKSVDLVLQTRQVRLNSGKTLILKQAEALRHFRVMENARLDVMKSRVERKRKAGADTDLERRVVELRIRRGLATRSFDNGNGEKVLKRWIGLAATMDALIRPSDLLKLFLFRPAVRDTVCSYIRRFDLSAARAKMLASAAESGLLVDDAASETWVLHERLGRVIGAFVPIFQGSPEWPEYFQVLSDSRNHGVRDSYKFHKNIASDSATFKSMFDALSNPNTSRGTGITHAKFLSLLSALQNTKAPAAQVGTLLTRNAAAWRDIYYRRTARRIGINVPPVARDPASGTEGEGGMRSAAD
jgi:hypothetical protein